jgi:hypothetical protein
MADKFPPLAIFRPINVSCRLLTVPFLCNFYLTPDDEIN